MLQGKSLTQGLLTGLLAGGAAGVTDSLAEAGQGAATTTDLAKEAAQTELSNTAANNLLKEPLTENVYQNAIPDANKIRTWANVGERADAAANSMVPQTVEKTLNTATSPSFLPDSLRQKYADVSAGLAQPDALKNALMSKSGMATLIGGVGSLMPDPNKAVVPPSTFSGSSYRPMGAYDRNYAAAPAGYDPNLGEYNYFPGDRYYRAAAGGSMQDILAQPVMPPNQMMGGSTPNVNQFYPGANIMHGGASSAPQSPSATDVVGGYDQSINQYTGEPVRMARGGVAAFDKNSEMSAIRALRRAYPHRADAERDAMVKGSPAQQMGVTSADSPILTYAFGPKQELSGRGDGMSDDIPAMIGGQKQARLSDGEFVIPADVVSGLGNGSTKAGSDHLYGMLDRVREARTGTKKQGKQVKAGELMPA